MCGHSRIHGGLKDNNRMGTSWNCLKNRSTSSTHIGEVGFQIMRYGVGTVTKTTSQCWTASLVEVVICQRSAPGLGTISLMSGSPVGFSPSGQCQRYVVRYLHPRRNSASKPNGSGKAHISQTDHADCEVAFSWPFRKILAPSHDSLAAPLLFQPHSVI